MVSWHIFFTLTLWRAMRYTNVFKGYVNEYPCVSLWFTSQMVNIHDRQNCARVCYCDPIVKRILIDLHRPRPRRCRFCCTVQGTVVCIVNSKMNKKYGRHGTRFRSSSRMRISWLFVHSVSRGWPGWRYLTFYLLSILFIWPLLNRAHFLFILLCRSLQC